MMITRQAITMATTNGVLFTTVSWMSPRCLSTF